MVNVSKKLCFPWIQISIIIQILIDGKVEIIKINEILCHNFLIRNGCRRVPGGRPVPGRGHHTIVT